MDFYSDLALEERERSLNEGNEEKGYRVTELNSNGFPVSRLEIFSKEGERALNRESGVYSTVTVEDFAIPEESFEDCVKAIAKEIEAVAKLKDRERVLVVGLGNDSITPDALGPAVLKKTVVTRHLIKNAPDLFFGENMREVFGIVPGVLGQTGIESFEIVESVVKKTKPDLVVLIDSLAAKSLKRLTRAVQISDRGLIPGGGVGNSRAEISEKTLGVRCVSIGIPTVVTAENLISDSLERALVTKNITDISANEIIEGSLLPFEASLIVTPKDIRKILAQCAKVTAYAVNYALHSHLDCNAISDWLNY